jgi:hypothetical protein
MSRAEAEPLFGQKTEKCRDGKFVTTDMRFQFQLLEIFS